MAEFIRSINVNMGKKICDGVLKNSRIEEMDYIKK